MKMEKKRIIRKKELRASKKMRDEEMRNGDNTPEMKKKRNYGL